jgi:hypothetical protein
MGGSIKYSKLGFDSAAVGADWMRKGRFPEIFAPDSRVRFTGSVHHHAWIEAAYDALTNAEWLLGETSASWN